MKQYICVFAVLVAFAFTNIAHAEFIVGAQLGSALTTIDHKNTGSETQSGGVSGIFGQHRFAEHGGKWGIHVAVVSNSPQVAAGAAQSLNVRSATGLLQDALVMRSFGDRINGRVNSFAMFGISSLLVEDTRYRTNTVTGFKVAAGLEHPFTKQWVMQATWGFAYFGRLDNAYTNAEFFQTSFRFNIGYRF